MSEILPPAHCRRTAYEAFRWELRRLETTQGLFRAAFSVALHERPEADLPAAETVVENLIFTVRSRVSSDSPDALLAHLHDVLFEVFGLRGNAEDYYNPANSYLCDVLATRRGLPITLSLVYKLVAEGVGLEVHGVNAPGHFLVEVEPGERGTRPLYIDPFHGGQALDPGEVVRRSSLAIGRPLPLPHRNLAFRRATHRDWISRMLMNLRTAFSSSGRERDALAMDELQMLLGSKV